MGALEEIRQMQSEGKSDQEIITILKAHGYMNEEISSALTQSRIKEAVNADSATDLQPSMMTYQPSPQDNMQQEAPSSQQAPEEGYPQYSQQQYEEPAQERYAPQQAPEEGYPQYSQQQESPQQYASYQAVNSDIMAEIAEQVLQEKLSETQSKLQQISSFKSIMEGRVDSLDERLRRIERMLDRLQLSILQKVGEYVTNVEDIKKEMVETQKSFKSLLDKKHHK